MARAVYRTPLDAEAAFYDAFQSGDLDRLMAVWADEEPLVCVHPLGERLLGRAAIAASWRRILSSGQSLRFQVLDAHTLQDQGLSVHCVIESIDFGLRLRQHSEVIATNVYRLTDDGWRMIVHHASPRGETLAPTEPDETPRAVH